MIWFIIIFPIVIMFGYPSKPDGWTSLNPYHVVPPSSKLVHNPNYV